MNYRFTDLVDISKLQNMTDLLYKAAGILTAILDLEGNILTASGWRKVCLNFHRKHEVTRISCTESDRKASRLLQETEEYCVYQCRNGLIDAATRIVVRGRHVANVYTGQLLLGPPNLDNFREQARTYGFDETAYIEAIHELPVISEEQLRCMMEYLSSFAELLGELGYREISQREAKEELEKTVEELENTQQVLIGSIEELKKQYEIVTEKEKIARQHEELWEYAVERTGLIVYDWNVKNNQLFFTKTFKELLGFEATEFIGDRQEYIDRVHPDDREKLKDVVDACLKGSTGIYRNEYRIKNRYGKYI